MKIPEALKTEKFQHSFEAALVVLLLIILPMWGEGRGKYAGGIAMLVAAVLGLAAYWLLFAERLRGHWLKRVILPAGVAAVVAAALVIVLSRWH